MKLFVANWKMHMSRPEARAYAEALSEILGDGAPRRELVLAPPYTALEAARDLKGRWSLAGQNVAAEARGAFTGEVSAAMLSDAGCRYVIVGHSERRRIFGEGEETLAKKLARVREAGLVPIYCVGETGEERAAGQTSKILARQTATLAADSSDSPLVVAYEPVWAIGTGVAATPRDAGEARARLAELLSARRSPRVLYGGSVTPENAEELLEVSRVDGFLIGRASLNARSFAAIAGLSSLDGYPAGV